MLYNIIFDFDGTLFRTETVDISAINMSLEKFGCKTLDEEEILSYIGLPMNKISENCLKSKDRETIEKFSKQVIENELLLIPRFSKMYPFAISLLDILVQKGHKLAICSNGGKRYILKLIDHFDIAKYFETIRYKRYGFSKHRAAKIVNAGFKNERSTIFVGDRKEDMDVAKDNGFISIGMRHGFAAKNELDGADYIAKDLKELNEIINDLEIS